MRRRYRRSLLLLTGLALVAAACGDDTGETTSTTLLVADTTTTTSVVVTTTPVTTTTTLPGGPALITEGDSNETVAAFQWLLDCAGFANLTVDGNFGSATGTALQTALTSLGRPVPDDDAFGDLSRLCTEVRPLVADDDDFTVVGNASPEDAEHFLLPLIFDSALTITITPSDGVLVTLHGPDGTLIGPGPATGATTTTTTSTTAATTTTTLAPTTTTTTIPAGGTPTMTWAIGATAEYTIVVSADFEPVTFTLDITIDDDAVGVADWLLTTTGITYQDKPKLAIGNDGEDTIDKIFEYLGHGVRGGTEFDTGWTPDGFRGVAIEGFRFLFYGPSPGELGRIRIFAPGTDAAGNPRPAFYATTPQGIGPGNTRAQLLEIYPGLASGETDDGDHFYRLTNSGGELCFYFGEDTVTDASVIVEISTECRS